VNSARPTRTECEIERATAFGPRRRAQGKPAIAGYAGADAEDRHGFFDVWKA